MAVVPRRPIAGTSQKPAPIAPAAAPAVFAAYNTLALDAGVRDARADRIAASASQATPIGNVPPMAIAGTVSSSRLEATRTSPKRIGSPPSAYARARTGHGVEDERQADGGGRDQNLERGVVVKATVRPRLDTPGQPGACCQAAHDGGQHGARRGDRMPERQRKQPRPDDLIQERRRAGRGEATDEHQLPAGHQATRHHGPA